MVKAVPWRVAFSLLQLRKQIDAAAPNRSKASDGTIGDTAHSGRSSDHNAWVKDAGVGVVTALDITHDLANGVDCEELAAHLLKDNRVKYIIWNRRIWQNSKWKAYTGANPHSLHIHISVSSQRGLYDSDKPWEIGEFKQDHTAPTIITKPLLTRGSYGPAVRELRALVMKILQSEGDAYGTTTEAVVKALQQVNGLKVDGKAGRYTWEALERQIS